MMRNLTGQKFGRWTVISYVGRKKSNSIWRCRCECGNVKDISLSNLSRGASLSCGCLRREMMSTHGKYKTRTYQIWINMKRRCADIREKNYGAKGINVCERWKKYEAFLEDMGEADCNQSIDRINNNGNYEPVNCRWATQAQQMRNTSRTRMITFRGETLCLLDWAKRIGISQTSLAKRFRNGWPIEKALMIKEARCS